MYGVGDDFLCDILLARTCYHDFNAMKRLILVIVTRLLQTTEYRLGSNR